MSWSQTELDTCQEAFYLLRQDVDVPTVETADTDTTTEWKKCAKAFRHARAEVLAAHDWTWARTAVPELSSWPQDVRNALVYCTARELAIPIAGRIADMQNMDALYRDKLVLARVKDLESETTADVTAKEVFAALRSHFSTDDKRLPRSLKKIADRIGEVEQTSLDEILGVHVWQSDVSGQLAVIYNALLKV